jgi:tRNA synthetases class I (I, L, M and V)
MADAYYPTAVEAAWQDWWEASGFYSCDPATVTEDAEKFVMVIPPPNVTGSLHLGHALTAAVEDTLTRWHRMKGHATLYVPGTYDMLIDVFARVLWAATRAFFLHDARQSAPCYTKPTLRTAVFFAASTDPCCFLGIHFFQVRTTPELRRNRWWKKCW